MIKIPIILLLTITTLSNKVDFQKPFTNIYDNSRWGDGKNTPKSGPGSDPCKSLKYLMFLQHFIDKPEIKKIVEIGFGDWSIMGNINLQGKSYFGFEVVKSLLRKDTENMKFKIVKGIHQVTQKGDFLIIRDVMQHWPTTEIKELMQTILPKFKYALLTNDYTTSKKIAPAKAGGYRLLNLDSFKNMKKVLRIGYQGRSKVTYLYSNPGKV